MMKTRNTAGMALLVLAFSTGARADDVFEPSVALGVDGAYDSNIYNGRGPDFVTRVTPHLGLRVRDERLNLHADYDLGLWDYATKKARDSINHHAALTVEEQATRRLAVRLADEFVRAEDPAFLTRAGVVAPQTTIIDNFLDAAILWRATRRITLSASYGFHHTAFAQPPPPADPLHDGDEHVGTAALDARMTRLDELRLEYRMQYLVVDGGGFAVTEAPALGWRRQLIRRLDFRLVGGPLVYSPVGDGRGETALTWRGAATLRFMSRRFRFLVSAVRDLISGTGAGSVLWADYATVEARYQPDRAVELRAALSAFANGFAPDGDTRYDGVTADAACDFRILDWLRLGGYYSFRWQETRGAADALPAVTRHIVGARLTLVVGAEAAPPHREVHP